MGQGFGEENSRKGAETQRKEAGSIVGVFAVFALAAPFDGPR
jgi:hypothetical protein